MKVITKTHQISFPYFTSGAISSPTPWCQICYTPRFFRFRGDIRGVNSWVPIKVGPENQLLSRVSYIKLQF